MLLMFCHCCNTIVIPVTLLSLVSRSCHWCNIVLKIHSKYPNLYWFRKPKLQGSFKLILSHPDSYCCKGLHILETDYLGIIKIFKKSIMNWMKLAKKIWCRLLTACVIIFQWALKVYLCLLHIIVKIHIVFMEKKYHVSVTAMTFFVQI